MSVLTCQMHCVGVHGLPPFVIMLCPQNPNTHHARHTTSQPFLFTNSTTVVIICVFACRLPSLWHHLKTAQRRASQTLETSLSCCFLPNSPGARLRQRFYHSDRNLSLSSICTLPRISPVGGRRSRRPQLQVVLEGLSSPLHSGSLKTPFEG